MSENRNEGLFRKVALQRLSSPDRLDALIGLYPPRTLLLWIGTAIAVAAALFWGTAGRLQEKVAGRCLLISPTGVAEVTSNAAGTVSGMSVKIGERIAPGQEIARILRPDLFQQIELARARLAELSRRQSEVARLDSLAGRQSEIASKAERGSLAEQLRLAVERAEVLERRLKQERALFEQKLITRQTVSDTEQAWSAQVLEGERLRDRAKQLELQDAEEGRQRDRDRVTIGFQVNEARRSLEAALEIERQSAPVTSPYGGRVIEVKANNGVTVGYGAQLLQIERTEQDGTIEAAIYVPGGEGKLVSAGMPVELVPDYVKRQEFGFLRGRVEQVSEYPASMAGMRPLVQNDNLLKELTGTNAPIFVRASLERKADGRFAWSAAAQQPPPVRSGALCLAEITVAEKRPIMLVMPAIRRWLGMA